MRITRREFTRGAVGTAALSAFAATSAVPAQAVGTPKFPDKFLRWLRKVAHPGGRRFRFEHAGDDHMVFNPQLGPAPEGPYELFHFPYHHPKEFGGTPVFFRDGKPYVVERVSTKTIQYYDLPLPDNQYVPAHDLPAVVYETAADMGLL